MTGYDWFILCIAIPGMTFGFIALIIVWIWIIHEIWTDWRGY